MARTQSTTRRTPLPKHTQRNGNGRAPADPALTPALLAVCAKRFRAEDSNVLAMNAVTKTSLHNVAQSRERVVATQHVYSHVVSVGQATSQNSSGRCWLFAGLNPMRVAAMKSMNLDDKFELSQSYLMFWDKLEKANFFLQNVLLSLDEPVGSRLFDWIMACPIQDGGQWDMFVNLVEKYGVAPKSAMPETESSSSTGIMNARITTKLREFAWKLRSAALKGSSSRALQANKQRMLSDIYRMLAIHLGEPPTSFSWQWRDKDDVFHRDGDMTPKEFLQKHVPYHLRSRVCLIHCPQAAKRYNQHYTIEFLGNVVGGDIISYLNVEMSVLKKAALDSLLDGEPVWFGCDVGKMLDKELGALDLGLYDYSSIYGSRFSLDKAARLDYGESAMNHAMVLSGVDLGTNKKPLKWRVENSWGEKVGDKGFLQMTDGWFDEYVYEVAVDRRHVPAKALRALEKPPIKLPPWDPMGTLAL